MNATARPLLHSILQGILGVVALLSPVASAVCAVEVRAAPVNSSPLGGCRFIPIPGTLSRQHIERADEPLRRWLCDYAISQLAMDSGDFDTADRTDLVVVFTDGSGVPILPDLEAARERHGSSDVQAQSTCPTGELTFTFNSSAYPWSVQQLATLQTWLSDFYPAAKAVCGNPFFDISVNLRLDPTISYAGLYFPSINEMVMYSADSPDVVCHEMIHAFRDDDVIGLSSFEEGMTRMAEVEVFTSLPAYVHWDESHSYTYDVYYEGLNSPAIGSQGGNFFTGFNPLVKYQLGGYAWAKCQIENLSFLHDFNCKYFAGSMGDPSTTYTEAKLLDIAAIVQPTVEGRNFLDWYQQQAVLNSHPAAGYFLFQRMNQYVVDYIYRNPFGTEVNQANASIQWSALDYQNHVLQTGSDVTSAYGWISAIPNSVLGTYQGRLKLVASTMSPNGIVTNATLMVVGPSSGVFGVVADYDTGTVTITPFDSSTAEVSVSVVNGAFAAPTMSALRGKFTVTFTSSSGQSFSRQYTKDASDYYVELRPLPWTNLGSGLAGVDGLPSLAGGGTLLAGTPGTMTLWKAKGSALAILFVSATSAPSAFKGGTLVPVPVTLSLTQFTDGAGSIAMSWLTWPAGVPSGATLYFQYAIVDPAALQQASLSNALKATMP